MMLDSEIFSMLPLHSHIFIPQFTPVSFFLKVSNKNEIIVVWKNTPARYLLHLPIVNRFGGAHKLFGYSGKSYLSDQRQGAWSQVKSNGGCSHN